MMDLTEWFRANGYTDQSAADAVGLTRSYVHRIRTGQVHPSLGVALALHNLTKSEVSLEMLLPRALRPAMPKPPKAAKSDKPEAAKPDKPTTTKPDKPRKKPAKKPPAARAAA
jgi:transcriptional regulator with XRE-family HTH domain